MSDYPWWSWEDRKPKERRKMVATTDKLVNVADVEEGDFLTGLDSGYVIRVERTDDYWAGERAIDDDSEPFTGRVTITFHNKDGEECSLTMYGDDPIIVRRAG